MQYHNVDNNKIMHKTIRTMMQLAACMMQQYQGIIPVEGARKRSSLLWALEEQDRLQLADPTSLDVGDAVVWWCAMEDGLACYI
jgi:hypothetical protein